MNGRVELFHKSDKVGVWVICGMIAASAILLTFYKPGNENFFVLSLDGAVTVGLYDTFCYIAECL